MLERPGDFFPDVALFVGFVLDLVFQGLSGFAFGIGLSCCRAIPKVLHELAALELQFELVLAGPLQMFRRLVQRLHRLITA